MQFCEIAGCVVMGENAGCVQMARSLRLRAISTEKVVGFGAVQDAKIRARA